MAEPEGGNGNGEGKPRVTVELLGSKLDTVNAIIAGHAEATQLKLDHISDKIEPLTELPNRMARLEERQTNAETHIGRIWHTLDALQTDEVTTLRGRAVELADRPRKWIMGIGLPVCLVILGWLLQHGL